MRVCASGWRRGCWPSPLQPVEWLSVGGNKILVACGAGRRRAPVCFVRCVRIYLIMASVAAVNHLEHLHWLKDDRSNSVNGSID
eukprot:scaffold8774_cov158-Isochrysis_galbana.AAC.3